MAESYEDALLRIERRLLAGAAVSGWLVALERVLALGDDVVLIRRALEKIAAPKLGTPAGRAMLEAADAALTTSARLIHPAPDGDAAKKLYASARRSFAFSPELLAVVAALDVDAKAALRTALKVEKAGGDAEAVLASIRAAKNKARIGATRVVNQGANEATRHAADEAGLPVVWVAERNGCVRCLKYSGEVAALGKPFPGGLTYSSAGAAHPPLKTPPLHPHCRCHVEALKDQSYADALRREADRSVLRGFALESESRSARIDAAKTLLSDGVVAPKSVIKFAERSIKKGSFDTSLPKPSAPGHRFP